MRRSNSEWLRLVLLYGICLFGLSGIVACGGSSSDDDDDDSSVSFPTPTLPKNATKFNAMNATPAARSVLEFSRALPAIAGKQEEAVSVWDVIKVTASSLVSKGPLSASRVAAIDLDSICEKGSVSGDVDDSGDRIEGSATYDKCEPFLLPGIVITGTISIFETYDEDAGTYDFQIGGKLKIKDGADKITVVLNISERGNENSGNFTDDQSYSIDGLPDETYLVTTAEKVKGNYFSLVIKSGRLNVEGRGQTRLRLDVVPGNQVDVYLDTGTGFVKISTIDLATI